MWWWSKSQEKLSISSSSNLYLQEEKTEAWKIHPSFIMPPLSFSLSFFFLLPEFPFKILLNSLLQRCKREIFFSAVGANFDFFFFLIVAESIFFLLEILISCSLNVWKCKKGNLAPSPHHKRGKEKRSLAPFPSSSSSSSSSFLNPFPPFFYLPRRRKSLNFCSINFEIERSARKKTGESRHQNFLWVCVCVNQYACGKGVFVHAKPIFFPLKKKQIHLQKNL